MQVTSFPPVLSPETSVLILGSMPGQLSLKLNQYYAHPQNLFWPIMHDVLGIDPALPYPERVALLLAAGVGLWDVLKHCEREGSLDTDINEETEVPNDFITLLRQYPGVEALCFNGQKAEKAFRRHVLPSLPEEIRGRITLAVFPSTSPANASKPRLVKVEEWRTLAPTRPFCGPRRCPL